MSEKNLDDLILTDPEPENPKSKGVLILLALVVLLIIIGAVLANMIFTPSKEGKKDNVKMVKEEKLHPLDKSKKNNANDASLADADLAPLDDTNQMPPVTEDVVSPKNEKLAVGNKKDSEDINKEQNPKTKEEIVLEKVAKNNREKLQKVIHKSNSNNEAVRKNITLNQKIVHKNKPEVKKRHITYGGVGNVYIQVGSFSKGPTEAFIDKIIKAGFKYKIRHTSNGLRRVFVGPFRSEAEAKRVLPIVRNKIASNAFIKK